MLFTHSVYTVEFSTNRQCINLPEDTIYVLEVCLASIFVTKPEFHEGVSHAFA